MKFSVTKEGQYLYHLYQIEGKCNSEDMTLEIFKAIKYYYKMEIFDKSNTPYNYIPSFTQINVEIENVGENQVNGLDMTYMLVRLDLRLDSNYNIFKPKLLKLKHHLNDEELKEVLIQEYDKLNDDLANHWVNKSYNSPFKSEMKVIESSHLNEPFDFTLSIQNHIYWQKVIK